MPRRDGFDPGIPSWVDLSSTDVDAAKTFYAGLFGWQWMGSDMPDGGTYWMATLDGAPVAGLSALPAEMAGPGAASAWNTYINVEDVDDTVARAEKAGGQVILPPADVGDSGRMAFVQDTGGAAIGLWQPGTHKGSGVVNEPGALAWSEVYAPDTGATVAFYSKVFGWERGLMPSPDGSAYTLFKSGDATIGGTAPPQPGVAPHWQVWFGAADTDATAARAAELSGTVVVPPTDTPIGKIAFLTDPTGASFSVHAIDQLG